MSLNLTMVLTADSAAAKAALEDAARGVNRVTQATEAQTRTSRTAATAADAEAAAKRRNAQASHEVARANQQAAGATGNLVAQFNDIGMMLAAGQNPLQLAVQQGTQITQVIGGQGAAGAAQLLKTAFVQMLNPLNLITVGLLAAGAAAIQWLTGAAEEALTLEQRLDAVNDAIDAWRETSGQSFADLRETFGSITPELIAMQRELTALRIADIMTEADAAARQLGETLVSTWMSAENANIASLLGVSAGGRTLNPVVAEFKSAMQAVVGASGVGEQLAAVEALRERFGQLTGGIAAMSEEQRAFYASILETEAALRAAAVATGDVKQEIGGTLTESEQLRISVDALAGHLAVMSGVSISGVFTAAKGPASELMGIVDGIAGRMFALAQGIEEYGRLNVLQAADGTVYRKGIFQEGGMDAAARGEMRDRPSPFGTLATGAAGAFQPPGRAAGVVGGGAGAARDEASALQELITGLEGEIAALRVADPIQAEMLRHREALAGATDAERAKVEALITARTREQALMEGVRARAEFFEQIGTQALDALIMKGESFQDVLKGMIAQLIQAAAQAAIFGTGPFGSIFGGKSILAGLFPGGGGGFGGGRAAGGIIHGPGTGTSDEIVTLLSNGEFVVNARATARNRHLLEAINSGSRVPGYAQGGMVGGGGSPGGAGAARGLPATIVIDLRGAQGDQAIEEKVRRGAAQMISLYDREGLPVSVQRVQSDSRRRG